MITLEKIWLMEKDELKKIVNKNKSTNSLKIKVSKYFYEILVLEKEQNFIVEHDNFDKCTNIYEFMREKKIKYSLKNIWNMQEDSLKQILDDYSEHDITSLRVLVSKKYINIIKKHKYILDEIFYKNFLYTNSFEEGIEMFNFIESDEDAFNKLGIKLTKTEITGLKNIWKTKNKKINIQNLKISDYNFNLLKKFEIDKTLIKQLYQILKLSSGEELENKYIIDNFNINEIYDILYIKYFNKELYYMLKNIVDKSRFHYYLKEYMHIKKENLYLLEENIKNTKLPISITLLNSKILKYSSYNYLELMGKQQIYYIDFIRKIYKEFYDYDLTDIFIYLRIISNNCLNEQNYRGRMYFLEDIFKIILVIKYPKAKILSPFHGEPFARIQKFIENSKHDLKISEIFINYLLIISKIPKNTDAINFNNIIRSFGFWILFIFSKKESTINSIKEIIIGNNIENPYKLGINVHDKDRDKRTNLAIVHLLKFSQNINIEKYYNKFLKYSEKINETEALDRVLYGNNRKSNDFGGLLQNTIKVENILISGKELISKFWYFALKYKPDCEIEPCYELYKKEKKNLKHSVFKGLVDSLQISKTDGNSHVVCDPGKIQRLVVGVLQGRIKDEKGKLIMIDRIEEPEEKNENEIVLVTNYSDIKIYLRPFINTYLYENAIDNAEDLFIKLFEYINNLSENGTGEFGKVHLDYSCCVYYICMMAETQYGLEIEPGFSIISNYEFNMDDYIKYFLEEDIEKFNEANPEIVELKNKKKNLK
uniref:Uncharacterized protein n=1 Tax=viral metagenome TaxID=1070528 RepID=A0A6C0ADA3_9ZZZZ